MTRGSLLWDLHNQDIDIDDQCYCDEDVDDCDGDCENCEHTELDDRDEEDDECDCCDCEEDEHPDAQPDVPQYEAVNGPDHYNGTQCIEQMRHLYGDDAVRWFCICNAYKYRFRKGHKPGVDAEQDEQKARWYEDYASNMMSDQRYY